MPPAAGERELLGKVPLPQTPSPQNFLISFACSLEKRPSKKDRNISKDIAVFAFGLIYLRSGEALLKKFGILKPFSKGFRPPAGSPKAYFT
ncbi:hypothetical protein D0S45_14165 [Marinifilum sp. JC120]|nr:hypothetical protein D0S45_14165 [Marinifilum sp. JC120]